MRSPPPANSRSRYVLRIIGLGYLTVLVGVPVGLIFWRTFEHGAKPVIDSLTDPSVLHAFRVTAIVAFWAVLLNTIFGVGMAILLVRHRFPGRRLLSVLIDLPIAVSPVVVGLALILVYGRFAPIGGWLDDHGIKVIFAYPGMVLATMFVSLPLVVREVAPVLEEIGIEQEQAAWTLGANRRADVPQGDAAGDSLGARLRRRADAGSFAGRVRRCRRRVRPADRQDTDRNARSSRSGSRTSTRRRPTPSR